MIKEPIAGTRYLHLTTGKHYRVLSVRTSDVKGQGREDWVRLKCDRSGFCLSRRLDSFGKNFVKINRRKPDGAR